MCDDLRGVGFPDRVMIEDEARVELRLREDALLNPFVFLPASVRTGMMLSPSFPISKRLLMIPNMPDAPDMLPAGGAQFRRPRGGRSSHPAWRAPTGR